MPAHCRDVIRGVVAHIFVVPKKLGGNRRRRRGQNPSELTHIKIFKLAERRLDIYRNCIKGFLRAKKLWVNPPKAERAKPSLSSDYNLLFKNKIGERSLDIHRLFPDDERERYLHLFFSPVKMMKERCRLEDEIEQMQRLIERSVGQQITFGEPHTRFFDFLYDDEGRLVTALEKTEAVEKELERCGYFCIVTSDNMSAQDAYLLYYGRDASEKLFRADKTFLGSKTARVHSARSVKAKMLVEFIALIIRQRIYCLLKDEMLKLNVRKNYMTVPAAVKELDKIELVRINQGRYQLDHAITKNQEEILRAFGLTKNHVMTRASSISEMIAGSENTSFTEEPDDEDEVGDEDLYMTEVYDAEE